MSFGRKIRSLLGERQGGEYESRFQAYAFSEQSCRDRIQLEACITRLYHTVEKGLSFPDYRPGFGRENVEKLMAALEQYAKSFDPADFCYETALSCLHAYVRKNKENGLDDPELAERIGALPGVSNELGGAIEVHKPPHDALRSMNFAQLLQSRHSIRHFSGDPVDTESLKQAVALAQLTPSACNRQGWRTRIVADPEKVKLILSNQNGNRGFGQEIDKLLVVSGDLRCFRQGRETYQVFIDGGMYAENLINALYYYGIASIPLSASLTREQEKQVQRILGFGDEEVLILFIGVGTYPDRCLAARSERREAVISVY